MSVDREHWLHDALAAARRLEPTDAEVAAVVAAAAARRRRRGLARGGRLAAIALPALLLGATAAAAATGLIPVGDVIRGVGFRGDGRDFVRETVVASGASEGVGRWRITSFETREGGRCVKFALLDRAARRAPGPAVSGYCSGTVAPFFELGHGRRAAALARGEVVLYGTAPATARTVELSGPGGAAVATRTHVAPTARERYWVLAAPARWSAATLVWRDARGRSGGTLDVSHRFAGPTAPTVVASGSTPVAGRWEMTVYESRRLSVEGDVYSPEGLPCVKLRLLDGGGASGFCGVQPRTPGFTRGQTSVYATDGAAREVLIFGHAPAHADAVELQVGGRTLSTPTIAGPAGIPGRFWLLARPPADLAGGRVHWVDRDNGTRGRAVELLPP